MTTKDVLKVVILGVALLIVSTIWLKTPTTPTATKPADNQLCFYQAFGDNPDLQDITWLTVSINDGKATGEFHILPAEKDSKAGSFTGVAAASQGLPDTQVVNAIWSASAEGTTNQEELILGIDAQAVHVGFGEMTAGADGVYTYKDSRALSFIDIPAIKCEDLLAKTK